VSDLWLLGDTRERLRELGAGSVQTCVTSPPYWGLRDYGVAGQIGMEATFPEYVEALVGVFREVRRVLRHDGTLWLNLGDTYASTGGHSDQGCNDRRGARNIATRPEHEYRDFRPGPGGGLKPKDLVGIPWRVAFALQADGWYLRMDNVWHKPNPMPESVTDRPTKAHEYVFLLSKSERYFYDADAIRESSKDPEDDKRRVLGDRSKRYAQDAQLTRSALGTAFSGSEDYTPPEGRNRRSVWTVATQPFAEAHFATMPPALAEPCILAGAPVGGVVLDPFGGAGTTALVARRLGRRFVHIELNPDYLAIARRRVDGEGYQAPLFATGAA
jgi:DNA modification methylase